MTYIGAEVHESEDPNIPTVLAFDPGGTTGWAVLSVHPAALESDEYSILENITHWDQGQIEGGDLNAQADEILEMLMAWDSAVVLFEDFQLRTIVADLSPVRITEKVGWISQRLFDPPRPIFLQMPSMAMSTATNERLKRWKLYRRDGQEHARDATRHAITFMRRAKSSGPLRRAAFGDLLNGSTYAAS